MSPPVTSEWSIHSRATNNTVSVRIRTVEFANLLMILVCQGPVDRISSYVEGKRSIGTLSGFEDVEVKVMFGDRDDIWSQLITRRAVDTVKRNVLIGFGLSPESKNEIDAKEISDILNNQLTRLPSV